MNVELKPYGDHGAYLWQSDTHKKLDEYNLIEGKKTFTIKAARQRYGKSTFVKAELLKMVINKPGSANNYTSPTLKLAEEMYQSIVSRCSPIISNQNGSKLRISFVNGSTLNLFSAEQGEALRGFTVTGLNVIDEAAYIRDDAYFELISPWTIVHNAPTIMLSTPRYKSGFFWEYYTKGYNNNNIHYTFDWVRDYEVEMPPDILADREMMPYQKWKSEYLGLFLDGDSSVFGDFSKCLIDEPPPFKELYFGLDFGTGSGKDYTSLTALNEDRVQVFKWSTNKLTPTEQVNEIISILNKHSQYIRGFLAEQNSIGNIYIDMLKKSYKNITPFVTTNDSKRKLVEGLQVAIQHDKIKLLNDKRQNEQLDFYESKISSTNKVTYNAQSGKNDDDVISLMLANECYERKKNKKQYIISF